jgi:hypothetical protein
MIPNHVLNNLGPDDRVAVLARRGELRFLVHGADEPATAITTRADRDGCEVLATHMRDEAAILELVAEREPDVGGEG